MSYFESIADYKNGWMTETPKKAEVIANAAVTGTVRLLGGSNNRAVTIETEKEIFLQSYDTLILAKDKATGEIRKLWNEYSKTTLKHINLFLGTNYNKKDWMNL